MTDQTELACARCAELQDEKRMLITENTALGTDIASLQVVIRKQGADLQKAERKLSNPKTSPKSAEITTILEHWQSRCNHSRANIELDSDRADLVRKKLHRYDAGTLMDAIDGVALFPFKRYGKRFAEGSIKDSATRRATQIDDCMGKDAWIEDNRDLYRRAVHDASIGARWLWDAYEKATAQQHAISQLVLDALVAIEQGVQLGEPLERYLLDRRRRIDEDWADTMTKLESVA